jgi:alpha-tubulin suppressor-like RCC1 family protein
MKRSGARPAFRSALLSVAVVLGLLAIRCQPTTATQVLVRFAADSELRTRATRLNVEVWSQEGELVLERDKALSGSESELARVPVIPRDEDASRFFSVRGELFDSAGQSLGVERAMLGYVEDELTEVLLVFDAACSTVEDCGDGRRCQAGSCVGSCVDPSSGHVEQETPSRCSACERCAGNRCEPLEDGSPCGCESDRCVSGSCVIARPIRSVTVGIRHTCALDDEGRPFCWGANDVGQLGLGADDAVRDEPALVSDVSTWRRGIHTKSNTTCLHGGDEARDCWGENWSGQFGNGSVGAGSRTPVHLEAPLVRELTSGGAHYCGLEANGSLWCWGYNERGQLGIGRESSNEPEPQRITGFDGTQVVEAGGLHTCAIRQNDTLWCWGYNDSGQIGVGDLVNRTRPTQTGCQPGQAAETCITNWASVSLGTFHSCAIRKGGELWCWGGNGNAQLGVGTTGTDERSPLRVNPPNGWAAVSAGFQHTCAIRDDGSLWCWGNNEVGQLGNGKRERSNVPSKVISPSGGGRWEQVAAAAGGGPESGAHTCALRNDRTLWCWGKNESGQLGLGFTTTNGVVTPRRVCFPAP